MRDRSLWQRRLAPLLLPLSWGYARAMGWRRQLYAAGRLPQHAPSVPCVSVGNIAAGGGGKTPLALWLLQDAHELGLKAALLSRGYKGRPPELPLLVKPETPWQQCGDEPLLLARSAPQALVLVDPHRARAARRAEELGAQLLVMDDGMQHLRLARQLNLTLLRPRDLEADWGRVLPAGAWREPASALESADAFVLKCPPQRFAALRQCIEERLAPYGRPVFSFHLQPSGLVRLADGAPLAAADVRSYVFMSAVADNAQAAATAREFLGPPSARLDFPDHHACAPADLYKAEAVRRRHGAAWVVCTAKDAVKLPPDADGRLLELQVDVRFGPGMFTELPFDAWWRQRCQRLLPLSRSGIVNDFNLPE